MIDILNFRAFKSKKIDLKIMKLIKHFQSKNLPTMPIGAKSLMEKYQIPEGKSLGTKLKIIEDEWVDNNFNLSEKQIHKILSR